jgi:hypothetical protein
MLEEIILVEEILYDEENDSYYKRKRSFDLNEVMELAEVEIESFGMVTEITFYNLGIIEIDCDFMTFHKRWVKFRKERKNLTYLFKNN